MSNLYDLPSSHTLPTWRGNTYSLPGKQRLHYYGVVIICALLAVTLIGASIWMWFDTFFPASSPNMPWLPNAHPIVQSVLSLIPFSIGFLLLKFTVELYRTAARTRLLIAPEGFIYTSNGGSMWSTWDNAMRIERSFIRTSWQEGIVLRVPASITGRAPGFSIFSIGTLPWDRCLPLTPFGDLWRMPMPDQKAREDIAQVARKFLPADSIPNVISAEGALYHDIHRYAKHLFANEY